MADIIDDAQRFEAMHRESAIIAARAGPDSSDGPEIIDGVACCVECGSPIPLARLQAVPNASRCVLCQEEVDLVA